MDAARRRAAWDHTARICKMLADCHLKGRYPLSTFHPFLAAARGAPINDATIDALIAAWCDR